jgi:hypothetical protein
VNCKSIIEAKLILSNNLKFEPQVSQCVLEIFKTLRLLLKPSKFHLERGERREGFGAFHEANKVKENNFILIFFNQLIIGKSI